MDTWTRAAIKNNKWLFNYVCLSISIFIQLLRYFKQLISSEPGEISDDEIINSLPELDIDSDHIQTTAYIQDATNAILITDYLAARHDCPLFVDQDDPIVRYPNHSLYVLVETLGLYHSN